MTDQTETPAATLAAATTRMELPGIGITLLGTMHGPGSARALLRIDGGAIRRVETGAQVAGATVVAYDPQSVNAPFEKHGSKFVRVNSSFEACQDADALAILTEWHEFRRPNFARLLSTLKNPWLVDGRNLYEPQRMARRGFLYLAMGRSNEDSVSVSLSQPEKKVQSVK